MPRILAPGAGALLVAALAGAQPLSAQEAPPAPAATVAPPSQETPPAPAAAPPPSQETPPAPAAAAPAPVDPESIPFPELDFRPTPEDVANYDKYFYFHRPETDFATAYADLQECDAYARGLRPNRLGGGYAPSYPYAGTVGGAIGGLIGGLIAGAMQRAEERAERRRQRRSILLTCMGFKEYQAYGLSESLWEAFNVEENEELEEERRQRLLQIQARVASGPQPTAAAIVR